MLDLANNQYLNKLDKAKPIVLGLSGGVDSMVLFDLLRKQGFDVIIAHVNHHKRKQSEIEEKYIKELAIKLNSKIEVLNFFYNGEENFQALAHDKRYEFFYDVFKKYDASSIITAHHGIDNLETIIMNIIKGSNLFGYGGIKELSSYKDAPLIRPLLRYDKKEFYKYALKNNITYFEDSTNQEDEYLRNRIRHHIIPLMQKENPNLISSISNYSKQVFGAFTFIREISVKYVKENNNKINVISFLKLAPILQKDIINYLFDENGITSSENKINDIIELMNNNKPNLSYDLGNNYRFVKSYDECYLTEIIDTPEIREEINLYDTLILNDYGSFFFRRTLPKDSTSFIRISINEKFPLVIRHRKYGDKILIGNGHKKLKDFLIDRKIPKDKRDSILVVTNAVDEILWVVGEYRKPCDNEDAINFIFEEKNNE